MQFLLYAVFVLSGAAGLIYESIWSRYLGLFVGHSAYAQIIVLTIFLGGMSLGAFTTGRWSERLKEPLVAYAFIELAIGAIGLVFHNVFVATTALAYDSIFPHLAGSPLLLVIVKWTIASLLILPQSVLLGTTFPLMSAGVLRLVRHQPGRVLSLLYFANSLGASAGVLFAGFYLLAAAGLEGTLLAAAVLNGVVFLVTLSAVRLPPFFANAEDSAATPEPVAAVSTQPAYEMAIGPAPLGRVLLLVAFGTAIASFVYEISWIRLLSLVLGSATHSFELMLSAFILGLALGAFWAQGHADKFRDPLRALGRVQWLMGFAAMATIPLYLWSFRWTQWLLGALSQSDGAYMMFGLARYAFCLIVMLPATFFAGITLPVITKLLIDSGRGERSVGTVYAVNTLGSIVGVVLAGLVLMPLLGLKSLLILGAVVDMGLGVWLLQVAAASSQRRQRWAVAAAAGVLVMTLATVRFNHFDKTMLASGVYRFGVIPDPASRTMVYYHDGRTATVSVGLGTRDKSLFIATNGKPDASLDTAYYKYDHNAPRRYLGGDVSTQVLLPLITLAHAPHAKIGGVIGEGSGMTSHLLLGSPYLQSLTTIEIEPSMIAGSRFFRPANSRVFDDPRSHFAIEDAKSFFASRTEKFDIIVSEPSNPWVSGVSGLFTVEFYARVKKYLTPDGVFGQWLHLYEIDDGLVLSVLAAIHQNFPSYEIYMTSNADILIVASNRSTLPVPDWSVFEYPMITQDLGAVVRFTPAALDAMHMASREALAPMLGPFTAPNSDYVPVLDLGAERARFMHQGADGIGGLNSERFDFMSAYFGKRVPFDTGTMTAVPSIPRSRMLAAGAVLHRRKVAIAQDSVSGLDVITMFQRRSRVENGMASGRPPADWHIWMVDALAVEKDLHGGTAGVVDEDFYKGIFAYLAAQHAPAGARQTFAFMHALALFDFTAMSALGDSLNPTAGVTWINVDDLRDGGTIAKLKLGDVKGARAYWNDLGRRTTRPPTHVRSLLINAYMIAVDRAQRARRGQPPPGQAPK
jgi:predicted membrane-bound spermidine synthase